MPKQTHLPAPVPESTTDDGVLQRFLEISEDTEITEAQGILDGIINQDQAPDLETAECCGHLPCKGRLPGCFECDLCMDCITGAGCSHGNSTHDPGGAKGRLR